MASSPSPVITCWDTRAACSPPNCTWQDPAGRASLTENLDLCRATAGQTQLRRPEDWLPAGLVAGISERPPVPNPVPTAPASAPPMSRPTTTLPAPQSATASRSQRQSDLHSPPGRARIRPWDTSTRGTDRRAATVRHRPSILPARCPCPVIRTRRPRDRATAPPSSWFPSSEGCCFLPAAEPCSTCCPASPATAGQPTERTVPRALLPGQRPAPTPAARDIHGHQADVGLPSAIRRRPVGACRVQQGRPLLLLRLRQLRLRHLQRQTRPARKGSSPKGDPSTYAILDVTIWRGAGGKD